MPTFAESALYGSKPTTTAGATTTATKPAAPPVMPSAVSPTGAPQPMPLPLVRQPQTFAESALAGGAGTVPVRQPLPAVTPQVTSAAGGAGYVRPDPKLLGGLLGQIGAKPVTTPPKTAPTTPVGVGVEPGHALPPGAKPLPGAPGAAITPFGPGQDYRFSAITPGQGADRYAIAQQRFNQFAQSTNPEYEATLRDATKLAAANGTLGSGMLTNRYGDVANQRAQALDLNRQGFLTDALEGTIGDQAAYRNELRGERQYQYGTSQDAIQNALRQRLSEEDLQNSAFNRQQQQIQTLGNLGYQGNPAGVYGDAASQAAQQAAATGANTGDLFQQWAYRNEMGGYYPATPGTYGQGPAVSPGQVGAPVDPRAAQLRAQNSYYNQPYTGTQYYGG